jgi:hypothetical protein
MKVLFLGFYNVSASQGVILGIHYRHAEIPKRSDTSYRRLKGCVWWRDHVCVMYVSPDASLRHFPSAPKWSTTLQSTDLQPTDGLPGSSLPARGLDGSRTNWHIMKSFLGSWTLIISTRWQCGKRSAATADTCKLAGAASPPMRGRPQALTITQSQFSLLY